MNGIIDDIEMTPEKLWIDYLNKREDYKNDQQGEQDVWNESIFRKVFHYLHSFTLLDKHKRCGFFCLLLDE